MIRKDFSQDADRPHYYSQFWVDVAAGKPIGGNRTAEREPEDDELDFAAPPEPVAAVEADEIAPAKPRAAKAKPEPKKQEPARSALTSLADLANIDLMMKKSSAMDDDTVPDIEGGDSTIVTDFDPSALATEEAPAEESLEFAPEDFDEEDEWGESDGPRRGSKPAKRRRPEPRRDY
jgi:hypothetical protein